VRAGQRVLSVVIQIALIDIVFSLDSVFTAVGWRPTSCRSWWRPSSCRSW
jgi:hypothetical protein